MDGLTFLREVQILQTTISLCLHFSTGISILCLSVSISKMDAEPSHLSIRDTLLLV